MTKLGDSVKTSARLGRLTANEKECLRRRLLSQTAKEMARELNVSSHAIEKRLKMARAKLGVSTSLEAARMWANSEEYQQLGPNLSDLPEGTVSIHSDIQGLAATAGVRPIFWGVFMMLLVVGLLGLAAVAQSGTEAGPRTLQKDGRPIESRKASLDDASRFLRHGFAGLDRDHSGFLEPREVAQLEPTDATRDRSLPPAPAAGAEDRAAADKWMGKLDRDKNGSVSVDEYVEYMTPWILLSGVPADWQ